MDRADSVYGFDLNDDQAGNEQVYTIAKFKPFASVSYRKTNLAL